MAGLPYVSIIIPIFNAERFIAKCITSIIKLNRGDWELIIIDDGSNDRSLEICKKFEKTDERIRIITQPNGGASKARNKGLDIAKGSIISFIDADDWVDKDFLDHIDEMSTDIIYFGFKEQRGEKVIKRSINVADYPPSDKIDELLMSLLNSKEQFYGYTCNKFFRKDIIDKYHLRFNESLIIKEDEEFIIRYCRYIKTVSISSTTAYNYRIISSSISHRALRHRKMTELASVIEDNLIDYPWKKFELEMRRRLYQYYKMGVLENVDTAAYPIHLKYWLDFYHKNKGRIELVGKGYIKFLLSTTKYGYSHLSPKTFLFLNNNPSLLIIIKRFMLPLKLFVVNVLQRKMKLNMKKKRGKYGDATIVGDGELKIGEKVVIHNNCSFCFNPIGGNKPEIILGYGVNIGKYNDFGCSEKIIFEDYVITAPFVHITDRNHCYEDVGEPIMHQPTSVKGPVKIGAGSWLGFGVQIMSGVTIGKQCVVAAGSIVTKDIPDYSVVAGNPARVVKQYNIFTGKWERFIHA